MLFAKIKNFILNKENLIFFYFYGLLIQKYAFLYIFRSSQLSYFQYFFWIINPLWFIAIIIYDLHNKKLHFKEKTDLAQIIFIIFISFCYLFLATNHDLLDGNILLGYIELGYILFTYPEETNLTKIKSFFDKLSNHLLAFIVPMTVLSLILYIFHIDEIPTIANDIHYMVESNRHRYIGLFRLSTEANFFCSIGVLLHLSKIYNHKKIIPNTILGIIDVILIILSRARLGILILFTIFIYYLLLFLKSKVKSDTLLKQIKIYFLFVILIDLILFLYKNSSLISRILEEPFYMLDVISSGRLNVIPLIFNAMTGKRLIYGYGWNNNSVLWPSVVHPHNIFFAVFLYTGIIGTVIFMIFFIQVILRIKMNIHLIKKYHLEDYLLIVICIFISSLLEILIVGDTNINSIFFWLTLGTLCHLHLIAK